MFFIKLEDGTMIDVTDCVEEYTEDIKPEEGYENTIFAGRIN